MGFCTDDQYERFLRLCPAFEREIVEEGVILIKYFFEGASFS
jgi:polyphosphate kinase 2 (PPK2 family)